MSQTYPTFPSTYTYLNFDQGLGRTKKGIDWSRENVVLGTIGTESNIFSVATIAASQANTAIQAYWLLPGRTIISKITIACTALTAAALNAASFNLVLGTGAYVQGNPPGNGNDDVPAVAWDSFGRATGQGTPQQVYPAGGAGIATNPAVAGNAMFANDVVLSTANFPLLATGTGTGPTYGYTIVPSSPFAVWPNGGLMTLRFTTVATATITNFFISAYTEPCPLAPTYPSSQYPNANVVAPGQDY